MAPVMVVEEPLHHENFSPSWPLLQDLILLARLAQASIHKLPHLFLVSIEHSHMNEEEKDTLIALVRMKLCQ